MYVISAIIQQKPHQYISKLRQTNNSSFFKMKVKVIYKNRKIKIKLNKKWRYLQIV